MKLTKKNDKIHEGREKKADFRSNEEVQKLVQKNTGNDGENCRIGRQAQENYLRLRSMKE